MRDTKIAVQPFQVLEDIFMRTYASSRVKRGTFYRKSELQARVARSMVSANQR